MYLSASLHRSLHVHRTWSALVLCLFGLFAVASASAQTVPVISGAPGPAEIGKPFSFRPTVSNPSNLKLTFSIWAQPSWARFDPATGTLSGTPTTAGTWSRVLINATYSDQRILGPYFDVVVVKSGGNRAPTISGSPAATIAINKQYSFTPTASDADGDALTFSIANKPAWATFSSSTGRLYGAPAASGIWSNIVISVTDGKTKVSLPAFSISTQSTSNVAPTISGSPATSVAINQAYSFQPSANDANGDVLTFSITNKPTWATFNTGNGRLSGTPTAAATHSNIAIKVSDGKATASLPAFTISVSAAANRAPTISGTPATSINAGTAYSFRPAAADADGDALTFSIANQPAWATFSTSTGQLAGTPAAADVGNYPGIVISVRDGKTSVSLPAFAISVNQVSLGSATLMWTPPTQNTDGSALSNLAGYRILYGTSASALTQTVQVSNVSVTTYVIENLAPATYYFAVKAYTTTGAESANSNVANKVIR